LNLFECLVSALVGMLCFVACCDECVFLACAFGEVLHEGVLPPGAEQGVSEACCPPKPPEPVCDLPTQFLIALEGDRDVAVGGGIQGCTFVRGRTDGLLQLGFGVGFVPNSTGVNGDLLENAKATLRSVELVFAIWRLKYLTKKP
jgi:hypothetical protein